MPIRNLLLRELIWASQVCTAQDPWLVDVDVGMTMFSKASVVASSMNQADMKETAVELMKLFGNFEGLQSKYTSLSKSLFNSPSLF